MQLVELLDKLREDAKCLDECWSAIQSRPTADHLRMAAHLLEHYENRLGNLLDFDEEVRLVEQAILGNIRTTRDGREG